jgi:hypothetical protein
MNMHEIAEKPLKKKNKKITIVSVPSNIEAGQQG